MLSFLRKKNDHILKQKEHDAKEKKLKLESLKRINMKSKIKELQEFCNMSIYDLDIYISEGKKITDEYIHHVNSAMIYKKEHLCKDITQNYIDQANEIMTKTRIYFKNAFNKKKKEEKEEIKKKQKKMKILSKILIEQYCDDFIKNFINKLDSSDSNFFESNEIEFDSKKLLNEKINDLNNIEFDSLLKKNKEESVSIVTSSGIIFNFQDIDLIESYLEKTTIFEKTEIVEIFSTHISKTKKKIRKIYEEEEIKRFKHYCNTLYLNFSNDINEYNIISKYSEVNIKLETISNKYKYRILLFFKQKIKDTYDHTIKEILKQQKYNTEIQKSTIKEEVLNIMGSLNFNIKKKVDEFIKEKTNTSIEQLLERPPCWFLHIIIYQLIKENTLLRYLFYTDAVIKVIENKNEYNFKNIYGDADWSDKRKKYFSKIIKFVEIFVDSKLIQCSTNNIVQGENSIHVIHLLNLFINIVTNKSILKDHKIKDIRDIINGSKKSENKSKIMERNMLYKVTINNSFNCIICNFKTNKDDCIKCSENHFTCRFCINNYVCSNIIQPCYKKCCSKQFLMDDTQLLRHPYNYNPAWINYIEMLEKLNRFDGKIPCPCHTINEKNNVRSIGERVTYDGKEAIIIKATPFRDHITLLYPKISDETLLSEQPTLKKILCIGMGINIIDKIPRELPILRYSTSIDQDTYTLYNANFKKKNSRDGLEINGNTISSKLDKEWSTCRTDIALNDSCVYYWEIIINKTKCGNIIVGVMTQNGNFKHFLGQDRESIGYTSNQKNSLKRWNNIMFDNQTIALNKYDQFKENDRIGIVLDLYTNIISFSQNDKQIINEYPIQIDNGRVLYPAFSLYDKGDKISLQYKKTFCLTVPTNIKLIRLPNWKNKYGPTSNGKKPTGNCSHCSEMDQNNTGIFNEGKDNFKNNICSYNPYNKRNHNEYSDDLHWLYLNPSSEVSNLYKFYNIQNDINDSKDPAKYYCEYYTQLPDKYIDYDFYNEYKWYHTRCLTVLKTDKKLKIEDRKFLQYASNVCNHKFNIQDLLPYLHDTTYNKLNSFIHKVEQLQEDLKKLKECLVCTGDFLPNEGLTCQYNHFLCKDCFDKQVKNKGTLSKDFDFWHYHECNIPCVYHECELYYSEQVLFANISEETADLVMEYRKRVSDIKKINAEIKIRIEVENEANKLIFEETKNANIRVKNLAEESLKQSIKELWKHGAAWMCPKCKYGPVEKDKGCANLQTHDGDIYDSKTKKYIPKKNSQKIKNGSRINNRCPQCDFFPRSISEWDAWDGIFRNFDLMGTKKSNRISLTSGSGSGSGRAVFAVGDRVHREDVAYGFGTITIANKNPEGTVTVKFDKRSNLTTITQGLLTPASSHSINSKEYKNKNSKSRYTVPLTEYLEVLVASGEITNEQALGMMN